MTLRGLLCMYYYPLNVYFGKTVCRKAMYLGFCNRMDANRSMRLISLKEHSVLLHKRLRTV